MFIKTHRKICCENLGCKPGEYIEKWKKGKKNPLERRGLSFYHDNLQRASI
jgi:hypothetical protein